MSVSLFVFLQFLQLAVVEQKIVCYYKANTVTQTDNKKSKNWGTNFHASESFITRYDPKVSQISPGSPCMFFCVLTPRARMLEI